VVDPLAALLAPGGLLPAGYRYAVTHVDAYLEQVALQLRGLLGDDLVAIYLHGSAAMRAFVPTRSDIDILVVTSGRVAPDAKAVLAETLPAIPCPGVALRALSRHVRVGAHPVGRTGIRTSPQHADRPRRRR
jgi:hypothetical protein